MPASEAQVLAIDAGNTRIKWGLHDGRGWARKEAVATVESATLTFPAASVAIACNVAGAGVRGDLEAACARAGMALQVVTSQPAQLGVSNGYRDPAQLGPDRWAALIAAHHDSRGHKLVVNAGTALTIDALRHDGRFLGGVIVPGPTLMRRSLDRGTAGLRLTEGDFAEFPGSTPDAITTGALLAGSGAVMRMAEAMQRHGCPPARVILSGGAAAEIAPRLPFEVALRENLVLDGLVLMARSS
jgi:type III pantothenate kinase